MKRLMKLCLLLALGAAIWTGYSIVVPAGDATQRFVVLRSGSSARAIAAELARSGVIRNQLAFLALHYAKGRTLKAGEYAFDHPASSLEVYDRIARGDVYVHVVVVPEGFNMFDIADALDSSGLCAREEFLREARAGGNMVQDLAPEARSLEGFLFPDTYKFGRAQGCKEMIAAMVKRFRQEAQSIGLTQDVYRIVTMASIVEKETALPGERPLVAGVFEHRLRLNVGLATDPSVIYAALLDGRYDGTINQSDLHSDSPYNTYRHAGLPPGPIANPGRVSLEAAMHPVDTDYLYFVANNQGGHNFARTLEEHNRNVAEYRKGR